MASWNCVWLVAAVFFTTTTFAVSSLFIVGVAGNALLRAQGRAHAGAQYRLVFVVVGIEGGGLAGSCVQLDDGLA